MRPTSPAVIFILLTVMIDSMGVGLILPIMPDLLQDVGGGTLAQAAIWGGILSTTFALMQFLFGPLVGALSDRFGRRPVLLISLVVMALDYLVMAVAGSIWLLLAGRVVGGITAATGSTASAYMADISEEKDKAANFGLVGAAFGIGFVLGPLMGGLLAGYGTRAPFYAAAFLSAANAVFGWLVLRETVTEGIRRKLRRGDANPFGVFRKLARLPGIGALLGVYFLKQVAFMVYPAIWAFYGLAQFGWGPAMIGISLGIFGVMMAVVQGGLIRPIMKRMGERNTVVIGLGFDILSFGMLGFITSGMLALILIPLSAMGGVVTPALQGIMSRSVGPSRQGELQGALTSVSALAMILSPLLMTSIFARFSAPDALFKLHGAPFLLSAVLVCIALAVFLRTATSRPDWHQSAR